MYVIIFLTHSVTLISTSSDGMIIFPTGGVFANMGGVGVSMFFVS